MMGYILDAYAYLFSRKIFNNFNKFIFRLALRGLGVLNYKTDKQSGEDSFLIKNFSNNEKGVVFDVGANIGRYSKKIRELNKNVNIYCFEPHPFTFAKLSSFINDLNINAFNVGVGKSSDKLELYDYASNDGSSHASLYKDVIEVIHRNDSIAHKVNIIELNSFAIKRGIERVLLLKIDTEGHEIEVLKGFESYIRSNKIDIIHFEFNEMNVVSRTFFKDFWDFLPNYNFYRMVRDGLVPMELYDPLLCEIFSYQNIVAKLKADHIRY